MTGPSSHRSPIFIIGAGRSGTTMLSRIIENSPEVFNGYEFRYIWNYRAPFRALDLRLAEAENSASVQYIRKFFTDLSTRHGRVIIDKTPSNAWRIPFIRSVFPDAKFIHVVRDGRANVVSRYREWMGIKRGGPAEPAETYSRAKRFDRTEMIRRRWRLFQARRRIGAYPARRIPALILDNAWPAFSQVVMRRPARFGERTPGLNWIRRHCGVFVATACQWRDTASEATVRGRTLPPPEYLEVKFESLAANPEEEVLRLFRFLEISGAEPACDFARRKIRPGTASSWRSAVRDEKLERIRPILQPTMEYLGYEWE